MIISTISTTEIDRHDEGSGFAAVKLIHFHAEAAASLLLGNYHCLCQK